MDPAVDGNLEVLTLSAEEREVSNARSDANRLDFALLLKFFRSAGRFPSEKSTIGSALIADVAQQLGVDSGTVGAMSVPHDRACSRRDPQSLLVPESDGRRCHIMAAAFKTLRGSAFIGVSAVPQPDPERVPRPNR